MEGTRIITVFILIVTCIIIIFLVNGCDNDELQTDFYTEGLIFTLNEIGNAYSVSGGSAVGSTITIPSKYNGLPVTRIEKEAFKDFTELNEIIVPDSIVSIGEHAFDNTAWYIDSEFKEDVLFAGKVAYTYNPYREGINDVVFDEGTLGIADYAFISHSLQSVVFPNSILYIGKSAFNDCNFLTNIIIPSEVYIGEKAFYESGLENVIIEEGVKATGEQAFGSCTNLNSIDLPETLEKIEKGAFQFCSALQNITLPRNVSVIESRAFYFCSGMRTVILENNIPPVLADDVFKYGKDILPAKYYVPASSIDAYKSTQSWNDYNNNIYAQTSLSGDFVIDGGVLLEYTGNEAVVEIPSGIFEIGENAFRNNDIVSVVIPSGVEIIAKGAFYYCQSLADIAFSDTVEEIGFGAFFNCTALTDINLPESITFIDTYAFASCELIELTFNSANPPTLEFNALYSVHAVYVPEEHIDAYKTAPGWSAYASIIRAIPE